MSGNTLLTFVSVPNTIAIKGLKILDLMMRAIECEKLLGANVQKENNIRQYILLAQRMEELAIQALENKNTVSHTMSYEYLKVLSGAAAPRSGDTQVVTRLVSPFCPPDEALICAQILQQVTEKVRADLKPEFEAVAKIYSFAAEKKQTIVVVQNHLAQVSDNSQLSKEPRLKLEEEFSKLPVQDWLPDNSDKDSYEVFREHVWNQIRAANKGQDNGINPALAKNNVLTQVLQSTVYRREDQKGYPRPVNVRIIYADGSEGLPFTMLCLEGLRGLGIHEGQGVVTLHIGMVSSRHSEMDAQVQMYWFSNILVSQTRTSAETDQIAYQQTLKQFVDLKRSGKKYLIYFYQTGFQQVLVGFYRAIATELVSGKNDPPWFKIQPMFYVGDKGYLPGRPWC